MFYWKGRKDVRNYIRACSVCQSCKPLSLPIREAIWMDTILVVVDRLSKYAHFLALTHPFSALEVAQVYFEQVFKLHGLPRTIIRDRDKVFMSYFWSALFKYQQVALHKSTAYHPQTDGQTEVNRCLEGYMRCMTGERPLEWVLWLPLAESWYNANWHTAIGVTPYEVLYPSLHIPYVSGDYKVAAVDRNLKAREECIAMLKYHLQKAQQRMKAQADKHRLPKDISIGDIVYVKLQPYRQHSVSHRLC